jgi:hypothetical protein
MSARELRVGRLTPPRRGDSPPFFDHEHGAAESA